MLSLRLGEGLDLARVQHRYGKEFSQEIVKGLDEATNEGLTEFSFHEDGPHRVKLTTRGMLLSNSVISDVWAHLEISRGKLGYPASDDDSATT